MKNFVLGFSVCTALVIAAKKLFLATPTVLLGGYNRGNVIIWIGKREDKVLLRFCKAKYPSKYSFNEDVPPEDVGEPIMDIVFLELRDMPRLASQLLKAYATYLSKEE